jgi:hypothetical protein
MHREADYWDGIVQLLRRPWFERTWVAQEIVVARGAALMRDFFGNDREAFARLYLAQPHDVGFRRLRDWRNS